MATTALPNLPENEEIFGDEFEKAEKRLDHAVGTEDASSKKKATTKAPTTKKTVPTKGKAKQKDTKKAKKQVADKSSADTTTSLFASDLGDVITEDTTAKQDSSKGKETLLQLEEEEEIDWESDLDVDVILNRQVNKDPYLTACEALNIVPVSYIQQNLAQKELSLPFHGLGPLGSRALGKVLETNTVIQSLNLSNNGIESGGIHFGLSMCLNRTMTYLNLSNNNLSNNYSSRTCWSRNSLNDYREQFPYYSDTVWESIWG
jgi:hypothetical protein